jgi:uncharacterized protein YcfJ
MASSNDGMTRRSAEELEPIMKVAAISGAVIAALAVGSLATPTLAQDYRYDRRDVCQDSRHSNGATGAVLGGIAGVLIGSNLASHHGGRAGGAALGGVAGALLGNSIGRSSANSSCDGYYATRYEHRGYDNSRYGYADGRYDTGHYDNGRYGYDSRYAQPYRTGYDNRY